MTGLATDHGTDQRWQTLLRWTLAIAAVSLVLLTWTVVTTGTLGSIDTQVRASFSGLSGWRVTLGAIVSYTASAPVGFIALILLGFVFYRRERTLRPLFVVTIGGVLLAGSVYFGKLLINRPRPRLGTLPRDPEPSFPSGHTTTAVVVVGCLLILGYAAWSTSQRRVALALSVTYAAVIGISRVVLGVHWFSDVLAGWLLGTVIVVMLALGVSRNWPVPELRTPANLPNHGVSDGT